MYSKSSISHECNARIRSFRMSLSEERRNMSKRRFDCLTRLGCFSNAIRYPFQTHSSFASRNARGRFELPRIRSNTLERIGEALACLNRRHAPRAIRLSSPSWSPTGNSSASAAPSGGAIRASRRPLRETMALSVSAEHHLFLRQSPRQAAPPLRAAALGRIDSRPSQSSPPQRRGNFSPRRSPKNPMKTKRRPYNI